MPKFEVWEDGKCGYCGEENKAPEPKKGKVKEPHYLFECPSCGREGCGECMPGGRGIECPECEERGSKSA